MLVTFDPPLHKGETLRSRNQQNISWKTVELKICKQTRPLVRLICKCPQHLPKKLVIQIYNSFIDSALTDSMEPWGNAQYFLLLSIFKSSFYITRLLFLYAFGQSQGDNDFRFVFACHLLASVTKVAFCSWRSASTSARAIALWPRHHLLMCHSVS